MIKIPKNCTGCTACIEVCPSRCFSYGCSHEGFMVPEVTSPSGCIECGLCEKACPALNRKETGNVSVLWVGQNRDQEVLEDSSSGGVFSMLAQKILEDGGVVYGAAIEYEKGYRVKHVRVAGERELYRLRGSKYVQSDMSGIMPQVKADLESGRKVLFSGTPCQVSGLKNYLRKEYDGLVLVDLVCHGTPSPSVWEKYISEEKENFARKGDENTVSPFSSPKDTPESFMTQKCLSVEEMRFKRISFRDKRFGWKKFGFAFLLSEPVGEEKNSVSPFYKRYEHPYMRGFLADLFLRPSCHSCPTKRFSSGSDITLADAWGVENYIHLETIDKGVSLVIPHTDKGTRMLEELNVGWISVPEEILSVHNPAAYHSCKPHKNRRKFFHLIHKGVALSEAVGICLPPPSRIDKIIWSVNKRLKRLWQQ